MVTWLVSTFYVHLGMRDSSIFPIIVIIGIFESGRLERSKSYIQVLHLES